MGESLKERMRADLNAARRERDKLRTVVLTTILSDVRNYEIDGGKEAKDEDVITVVNRALKRRKESSEQMRAAGRTELADKEDEEAKLLSAYMPAEMTEAEVRELARAAVAGGALNLGAVMGKLMPHIKGRFDGKEANRIVKEELEAGQK